MGSIYSPQINSKRFQSHYVRFPMLGTSKIRHPGPSCSSSHPVPLPRIPTKAFRRKTNTKQFILYQPKSHFRFDLPSSNGIPSPKQHQDETEDLPLMMVLVRDRSILLPAWNGIPSILFVQQLSSYLANLSRIPPPSGRKWKDW